MLERRHACVQLTHLRMFTFYLGLRLQCTHAGVGVFEHFSVCLSLNWRAQVCMVRACTHYNNHATLKQDSSFNASGWNRCISLFLRRQRAPYAQHTPMLVLLELPACTHKMSTTESPLKNILFTNRSLLTGREPFFPLPVLGICKQVQSV